MLSSEAGAHKMTVIARSIPILKVHEHMKQAAVLGHPVSHSKSPVLHRTAYQLLGADIQYDALDLQPADSAHHAQTLRAGGWAGCSVTMPLKDAFIPHMDQLSKRVEQLGALNTIVVHEDGTLFGENTDVDGLVHAIEDFTAAPLEHAMILGSGNTALATLAACEQLGVQQVMLIVRSAHSAARALNLAAQLGLDAQVEEISSLSQARSTQLQQAPLVFSTLPPRAADHWVDTLGAGNGILLDVAYDPWPSQLAQNWKGQVISGLHMLVHQAVEQVRLFAPEQWREERRGDVTNAMFDSLGLARHQ